MAVPLASLPNSWGIHEGHELLGVLEQDLKEEPCIFPTARITYGM